MPKNSPGAAEKRCSDRRSQEGLYQRIKMTINRMIWFGWWGYTKQEILHGLWALWKKIKRGKAPVVRGHITLPKHDPVAHVWKPTNKQKHTQVSSCSCWFFDMLFLHLGWENAFLLHDSYLDALAVDSSAHGSGVCAAGITCHDMRLQRKPTERLREDVSLKRFPFYLYINTIILSFRNSQRR